MEPAEMSWGFKPSTLYPMKVFVTAEIGVNWAGDIEKAKGMIWKAALAGADAVKFQAFEFEHIEKHSRANQIIKSSVMEFAVASVLKEYAESLKIEWYATPFSVNAFDMLERLKVQRYKIRERDARFLTQQPAPEKIDWRSGEALMFRKILHTQKPVFVSTQKIPLDMTLLGNPNVSWLYCVPKYPPTLEDLDFSKMDSYQGYSNHYPEIAVPFAAVMRGARAIELHVVEDRQKDIADAPDIAVSLDFDELAEFVRQVRIVEKIHFG